MADPRTFTLIGEFKDGITPELERINKQLATLKSSFGNVGGKGARTASRDMGRFSASVSSLVDNLKLQNQALKSATMPLREYRTEIRRTTSALQRLNAAAGNTNGINATNRALTQQLRLLRAVSSAGGNRQRMAPRSPGGGGGGGMGGGSGMRPRGGGGGGGMGAHMGEFGFAYTLGTAISQPIQNAIVSGFQIGIGLMAKPFEYFAGAFGERIQDQLSDLKAAGGLFSVSQRSKTPFLKTMDEAVQYQQDTNRVFAKMAADLPGVTNDYVQVGKRLSDTMARITSGDFQNALTEANRIRGTDEGRKYYGQTITGTGADAQKQVITTLLGEMTKKTTLAGLGGRSGAGGVTGAYGLPGLTERMLSQQTVSMGQFQRYAAVFSDPTISDALNRNIDLVNKTMPNTAARFKAMQKLLDEVVTPDLIDKLRTSVDGVYQGLKSAIFDPDTGLFGLGRQFQSIGKKLNRYGQYVDAAGKVVDKLADAADTDLSIFEILADIFSNAGQVLTPIVQNLSLVFDPLKKVADLLMDARHYTAEFARTFNQYQEGLKNLSETKGMDFLKETLDFRSSLLAINNLLLQVGAIGKGDFMKNADILMNAKNIDFGAMISRMLNQLMNSTVAGDIGKMIGEIVGTVLVEVSKVTGFLSGRIASSNKLFAGLKKGFDAAKGTKAFKNIFKDVFTAMFDVLKQLIQIIPIEALFLGGMAILAPAMVQGLAMSFASRVWTGVQGFLTRAGASVTASLGRQAVASSLGMNASYLTGGGAGAGAAGAAGAGLLRMAGIIGGVVTALVLFEGGLENSTRQLNQGLGSSANSLGGIFNSLGVVIARVTGQEEKAGQDLSGNFDLIGAAMLPVTATFDLLEMSFRLLIEGFDNAALAVTKFGHWLITSTPLKFTSSKEDLDFFAKAVKDLEARLGASTAARNEARRQDDINYTSIRYNGREGYGKKVAQDIQSKQAKLSTLTKGSAEYTKINDDLFALKKLLVAITGSSTPGAPGAATIPKPGATPPKPGTPGAATGPIAVPPNSPAAAAITNTSTQTAQLNQKASVQVSKLTQTNVTLATIKSVMGTLGAKLDAIKATIQSGDMAIVGAINKAASSGGFGGMGGMGGGMFNLPTGDGVKKVTAAGKMLQGMGLNVAENPYFGNGQVGKHAFGSYHYAGRAIDVTGPPAKLDAAYAQLKNTNPAELLWRTAGHFDHLHVAYALGAGMPAFFGSQNSAINWEKSMTPGSVKVGSVTGNSSEGFGGGTTINGGINVTVNGSGVDDADALASMVAMKIGEAVAQARSASVFV